jgi:hypothetical protein
MASTCIVKECPHRCGNTFRRHRTAKGATYIECYVCGHIQVRPTPKLSMRR